jgi:hypothetical protein
MAYAANTLTRISMNSCFVTIRRFYRHVSFETLLGLATHHEPTGYWDIIKRDNPRKSASRPHAPRLLHIDEPESTGWRRQHSQRGNETPLEETARGTGKPFQDRYANLHTFRATGITAYLKNGGALENAAATSNVNKLTLRGGKSCYFGVASARSPAEVEIGHCRLSDA